MLYDNHGRLINYLRLAVTDRCNLRCFYCMPHEGIQYLPRKELLTYEEMERFVRLIAKLGIEKIRITGGEPFLRKDMMRFIERLNLIPGINQIAITTNGTQTADLVPDFKRVGIQSVNLSLDSLDADRFFHITRRNVFPKVMETFDQLLRYDIPTKLNAVVMAGKNIEDILPMVELTKQYPISVRFIEEMPFNGAGKRETEQAWTIQEILAYLRHHYPHLTRLPDPDHATAMHYQVPGYQGNIGIIAAYSRLFCGTCNRIRLTPKGILKTCLYDDGVLDVRELLRNGKDDAYIAQVFQDTLGKRAKDGFEAEQKRQNHKPVSESMATIGG